MLDRVEVFLLVIDWTTSFSSVNKKCVASYWIGNVCETEKRDWDITVCCFKHCTVESILHLVLYTCPHFLYLHIFFSSDSKFYWILSQERMCKTTKYVVIQYCLRVLVHVFVFKNLTVLLCGLCSRYPCLYRLL